MSGQLKAARKAYSQAVSKAEIIYEESTAAAWNEAMAFYRSLTGIASRKYLGAVKTAETIYKIRVKGDDND